MQSLALACLLERVESVSTAKDYMLEKCMRRNGEKRLGIEERVQDLEAAGQLYAVPLMGCCRPSQASAV